MHERMLSNAVDTGALRSREITMKTHKDNDQLRNQIASTKKEMYQTEK